MLILAEANRDRSDLPSVTNAGSIVVFSMEAGLRTVCAACKMSNICRRIKNGVGQEETIYLAFLRRCNGVV